MMEVGEVPVNRDPWDLLLFIFPMIAILTEEGRGDPPVPVETIIKDILIGLNVQSSN